MLASIFMDLSKIYVLLRFAMSVGKTLSISDVISETLKLETDLSWRFEWDHELFLLRRQPKERAINQTAASFSAMFACCPEGHWFES